MASQSGPSKGGGLPDLDQSVCRRAGLRQGLGLGGAELGVPNRFPNGDIQELAGESSTGEWCDLEIQVRIFSSMGDLRIIHR